MLKMKYITGLLTAGLMSTAAVGQMSLDLNPAPGDQGERERMIKPGDTFAVELVSLGGAKGMIGFKADIKFDKSQLNFKGFNASGLMAGAMSMPPKPDPSGIEINAAIMGGGGAGEDAGSLGQLMFEASPGFHGTPINIASASFGSTAGIQPTTTGPGVRVVNPDAPPMTHGGPDGAAPPPGGHDGAAPPPGQGMPPQGQGFQNPPGGQGGQGQHGMPPGGQHGGQGQHGMPPGGQHGGQGQHGMPPGGQHGGQGQHGMPPGGQHGGQGQHGMPPGGQHGGQGQHGMPPGGQHGGPQGFQNPGMGGPQGQHGGPGHGGPGMGGHEPMNPEEMLEKLPADLQEAFRQTLDIEKESHKSHIEAELRLERKVRETLEKVKRFMADAAPEEQETVARVLWFFHAQDGGHDPMGGPGGHGMPGQPPHGMHGGPQGGPGGPGMGPGGPMPGDPMEVVRRAIEEVENRIEHLEQELQRL